MIAPLNRECLVIDYLIHMKKFLQWKYFLKVTLKNNNTGHVFKYLVDMPDSGAWH